ncbi:MAG: phosphoserine phosphatase SerB [Alphaproteobacteria bacterium]|nr:phosphoserine phosphatase SerB [Alphaproteobacteria bacterium]
MKYVITIVGDTALRPLDTVTLDKAVTALANANAALASPDWLAKRQAVDIAFDGMLPLKALHLVQSALGDAPFDICAQPIEGRRKKLLVADMDSTILADETIDEIAAEVGKKKDIAQITLQAMEGKLKYADSLRRRVALLAGTGLDKLDAVLARLALNRGAATLIATMKQSGAMTVLVTGGFSYFTAPVAAALGFDRFHANQLEFERGRLTGKVKEPILDAAAKRSILETTSRELGIELRATVAVGDGANDLGMIEAASLGVAFRGKPSLAAMADAQIDHSDLTTVLYFQGFHEREIIVRSDALTFGKQ